MDRREFIRGTSAAGAVLTAGCTGALNQMGAAEMEWEYEWEGFVGAGFQPALIVTGEIEDVGSGYADEFDLDWQVLAEDGSIIQSRERRLRSIEENEEQLFYWMFRLDEEETEQVEEVEVEGTFPEQ